MTQDQAAELIGWLRVLAVGQLVVGSVLIALVALGVTVIAWGRR